MEIDATDAKTIAIALNLYNTKLVQEFQKIQNTPNVSEFVTDAAHQEYQQLSEAGTKLHIRLAQEFPELTQQ